MGATKEVVSLWDFEYSEHDEEQMLADGFARSLIEASARGVSSDVDIVDISCGAEHDIVHTCGSLIVSVNQEEPVREGS